MTTQALLGGDHYVAGQDVGHTTINEHFNRSAHAPIPIVQSKTTTAPPGSPSEGDAYIPAATATGDWTGQEHKLAMYYSGWIFRDVHIGEVFAVLDEGTNHKIFTKINATPTYTELHSV